VTYYQIADKVEDAWVRHNGLHASPDGNTVTYLNHWDASSQSINFDNEAGEKMRTFVWDEVKTILQQWSGVNLSPSSLYGKLYSNQSMVLPSVDSEPMIISALIRVSQDLVEPWIIEVIGHNGKAYNISLEEGEMLLYEGASVIHGRPFRMNGVHASVSSTSNTIHCRSCCQII
jgi:prolyl 4-hydroxylase